MTSEEFIAIVDKVGCDTTWCHFEASVNQIIFFLLYFRQRSDILQQGRIPEVTLECMRYLRLHFPAVQISVELEKPARKGLQALTAEADVVFYSKSWAQVRVRQYLSFPPSFPGNSDIVTYLYIFPSI